MRVRTKLKMMGSKAERAKTLALLCLMAHALFICFTHFHDAGGKRLTAATASVQASSNSDSNDAPDSTGDSHCLSCRLQRNFISDSHTAPVIIEAIKEPLSCESFLLIHNSRGLRLALSTRAPPLA